VPLLHDAEELLSHLPVRNAMGLCAANRNLVQMLGCARDGDSLTLLSEFSEGGDLQQLLAREQDLQGAKAKVQTSSVGTCISACAHARWQGKGLVGCWTQGMLCFDGLR